ncbi:MAG: hypothetical protein AAF696_06145 [Bacteroidota bacterium]
MKLNRFIIHIVLFLSMLILGEQRGFSRPLLSFFSHSNSEEFQQLISRPGVLQSLQNMGAEIRIGIVEMNEARAKSIQTLNEAGIPVFAWIKALEVQGSTFRVDNASSLLKRYQSFKSWSDQYGLIWQGVGIDLRPKAEVMSSWVEEPVLSAWNSYLNLFNQKESELAKPLFQEFQEAVHQDGYVLETYVLPFAMDEDPEEASGLQYLTRILNVNSDRVIPLCYTSYPFISAASILDYGSRAQRVGLGSTSMPISPQKTSLQALDWEMLSRDLRLAHDVCKEIHLDNLEGIVANGWLEAIELFDFSESVFLYSTEIEDQQTQSYISNKAFQALSYPLLSSILLLFFSILIIVLTIIFLRYLFSWKKKSVEPKQEEIDYEVISS